LPGKNTFCWFSNQHNDIRFFFITDRTCKCLWTINDVKTWPFNMLNNLCTTDSISLGRERNGESKYTTPRLSEYILTK
jgi:hypothetical protein